MADSVFSSRAQTLVAGWADKLTVARAELLPNNTLHLALSGGHSIRMITEHSFSMLSVEANGLSFTLNGMNER